MAEFETFQLKYDGAALADHTIDIDDLAPALIGLSELIQEANHIVNNDRASVSLKIKATEPGCFTIQVQAYQALTDAAVDFLSGKHVTALLALLALVGFGKQGMLSAIELIRRLKGKPPKSVTPLSDSEVQIELPSGEIIRANRNVWEISVSHKARTAIHKVVKPLARAGVEELDVIQDKQTVTKITKVEAPYFLPPEQAEEELQASERITHVSIVSLWFTGENKWKLNEGGNVFNATISDQGFIKKMLANEESFQAGDLLKVRLRQTQYMTQAGLKSEWEVVEVLEHLRGVKQIPLL